jgi:ribosomal protein S18 acetylase RimI-like enzyme
VPLEADIGNDVVWSTILVNHLRAALRGQIANLTDLLSETDRAGVKLQIEFDRFPLKLVDFEFHGMRVRQETENGKWAPAAGNPKRHTAAAGAMAAASRMSVRIILIGMNKTAGGTTGIRFREAVADDQTRMIALVNAAFSVETFLDGTRTDAERLAAMMKKGRILVAEDSSGLLGTIYMERRGARGYMGMLAVDPARQGEGLAHRMIAEAESRFRRQGCEGIDITVLSMRPELPPVYRRIGYVETGIEEFKPSQPLQPGVECQGIVMSKQL